MTVKIKQAFTLLELLISIFIVSIGLVALFGIVVTTLMSRSTIEEGADREVTALLIMNEMKRELESIYACPQCSFVVEEMGFFGKPFDRLIFSTYYGQEKEVEYRFELPRGDKSRSDTTVMLKRVGRRSRNNEVGSGGYTLKVLDGIKEFDVRVFSGGVWHERLNLKGSAPQIIDIKMVIEYGSGDRKRGTGKVEVGRGETGRGDIGRGDREIRLLVEPRYEQVMGGRGVLLTPK